MFPLRTITIISHDLNDVKSELWYDFIPNNHMHEITCYHASRFVQNGSFPWIRTTISGSRDRRNAFIRGRNTMPYERMLPYVHMTRNLFCPHLMVDGIRSGRRIRTAIREYESRVIPNFTTPASGMAGYRTRLTGFQSRVSHEYFIPVRVLFSCVQHAFRATITVAVHMRCNAVRNHCIHWLQSDWTGSTGAWWIVSSASIMRACRAPTGIRTRSLLFRRQARYPVALSGQCSHDGSNAIDLPAAPAGFNRQGAVSGYFQTSQNARFFTAWNSMMNTMNTFLTYIHEPIMTHHVKSGGELIWTIVGY